MDVKIIVIYKIVNHQAETSTKDSFVVCLDHEYTPQILSDILSQIQAYEAPKLDQANLMIKKTHMEQHEGMLDQELIVSGQKKKIEYVYAIGEHPAIGGIAQFYRHIVGTHDQFSYDQGQLVPIKCKSALKLSGGR